MKRFASSILALLVVCAWSSVAIPVARAHQPDPAPPVAEAGADASSTDAVPIVTRLRRDLPRHAGDPLAVRALDPTFDTYPDASLVDFSFLLDAPAGRKGWLETTPDGRFRFSETGEHVRLWGVTVAASHIDIPKERIPTIVQVIARAGCNLLRLHEIDNRGGERYNLVRRNIIDEAYPNHDRSTAFDLEYRDRVDYWIAKAQEAGLHVYLVVRGYRTFREGDGVVAADQMRRAAKPYAFFNPRLIELQKQYAREWLIEHVNPYTGIPNGLNPTVCLIELENEDSLFFNTNWHDLIEPYREEFRQLWNDWLTERYATTEALRAAWTDPRGTTALGGEEGLEDRSVQLPRMAMRHVEQSVAQPWSDRLDAPTRNDDGVRFAMDVQRRYFTALRDDLRALGAKAPFTAVVHSHMLPDTYTVAECLDFVGENAYLDHPSFMAGQAWVGRAFYSNKNYVAETNPWALMPHMARYRWAGSPLVCREWAVCWPNQFRGSGTLDIAAMSALQDYDGLIHFAYYTWGNPDLITPFGPQSDPVRWGLMPYAALLFQPGTVQPPTTGAALAYNDEDLAAWGHWVRPLQRLAWTHRVANWNPDATEAPLAAGREREHLAVTIAAGRSGTGTYLGDNLVLFDARYAHRAGLDAAERAKGILATSGYAFPWTYTPGGFPLAEVAEAGFEPFLVSDDASACRGFFDPRRNVIVLGEVDEATVVRVADWFLAHGGMQDIANFMPEEPEVLRTWNGQIVRDTKQGLLKIATERVCAVAGELPVGEPVEAGALTVVSASPIASVAMASLDGKPLTESRRVAVKMVTVASNRGQDLQPVDKEQYPNAPGTVTLGNFGGAPVQTEGRPSETPTRVSIAGRTLAEAYLVNGTWEIVLDYDKNEALVACDTPNTRFAIGPTVFNNPKPESVTVERYYQEHPPTDTGQTGWDFVYPGFAKYVRLRITE